MCTHIYVYTYILCTCAQVEGRERTVPKVLSVVVFQYIIDNYMFIYFYTSGTIYLNYVTDCVCLVSLDFDN